ncbi:MAG: hypothetical protein M1820_003903 [Bogoriella megaspora]|nr:MAG: hypothetical protein M1820_003903 [Bogoriella megaspora]
MAEDIWTIKEHIINASFIRALPRGIRDEENHRLRLHVKQWTPKANPCPQSGDVTVIFAHGVGSSKESYEVFFDYLLQRGLGIRSIWAMDVAHHGQSYMLNKDVIGDEISWYDAARDIIHMINTFQQEITPPIIGIGQSWGGAYLLEASDLHPRLFDGLILVEPTVATGYGRDKNKRVTWMMERQDWWPSREAAESSLRKLKYYQRFDPRVFERVIKYDIRDVTPNDPSFDHSATDSGFPIVGLGVTLTTPKAQEVYTMMQEHLEHPGQISILPNKATPEETVMPRFYRAEGIMMKKILPNVLPPVLYAWGKSSDLAIGPNAGLSYRKMLLETTGSADCGSGGQAKGKVREVWVDDSTHPIPFEQPEALSKALAPWLRELRNEWICQKRRDQQRIFYPAKINSAWLEKVSKL